MPKDEADVSCVCTEPDAKSTASDARVSHDTLTVERLRDAMDSVGVQLGDERRYAAILAALGEEKP